MPKVKPKKDEGGRPTKWRNEFYLQSHQLAKNGMTNRQISKTLGVSEAFFVKRIKADPALKDALAKARDEDGEAPGQAKSLKAFILGRLDKKARAVWDDLMAADKESNVLLRVDKLTKRIGRLPRRTRQHLFLNAWVSFNFDRSKACRMTGIPLEQFNGWLKYDPQFVMLVDQVTEAKKDFFESALLQQVKEGNTSAIIFGMKTLNSDRYRTPSKKVNVNVDGTVQQEHKFNVDDLPLETRTAVLQALRVQKEQNKPRLAELEEVKDVG